MTEHAELTSDRWARFSLEQQILQIGVEMHRGASSLRKDRIESLRLSYERVLRLIDLTIEVNPRRGLRRELLRLREVISELYLREEPDPRSHTTALRALLLLHPVAAEQVALLGL